MPPVSDALWVALTRNAPAGFALVEMLADDLPHLEEVAVTPSHGRRGLGAALVRTVCVGNGLRLVDADPDDVQSRALEPAVYARLGFVEVPRDQLGPELAAVVSTEATRGLAPEARAVTAYRCI